MLGMPSRFVLATLGSLLYGGAVAQNVTIATDNPFIHYNGRWDLSPGTWWTGSGFKLHAAGLTSLTLNLGALTTSPLVSAGVSVNYGPFATVNVSEGSNQIPLNLTGPTTSVVRINAEGWQDNRINLQSTVLNEGAKLLPYQSSNLVFQFIGDSLSAGQYTPQGVDDAWNFLTAEYFKAEYNINAAPGAALSDIVAYGNQHGVSYQYFKTEDMGYYYTIDHNYTTPWDFVRDYPAPTHVVIHIGANDASYNISQTAFVQTYLNFVARLRTVYREQPVFVFTPWGWPSADGSVSYYYPGAYEEVVQTRYAIGDENVFLVNTTGWVTWEDVYPTNQHPNVEGHQKIAALFESWLEDWGLNPEPEWATPLTDGSYFM
ncbi:SGNH hydrolase-type esterase domain-containing protein [Sparassis latifolia]